MGKRYPLPSSNEFKWGGISMLLSHLLMSMGIGLFALNYEVYNVDNEMDVITFHEVVSSNKYRIEIEIGCAFMWFAFPFLLIELHTWSKMLKCVAEGYCEVLPYIFEKAQLMWILTGTIILPALALVIVSYDWTFHETSQSNVPSGYYIQLSFMIFWLELIDCTAVCEAVFMISFFILMRYILYKAFKGVKHYNDFIELVRPRCCNTGIPSILSIIVAIALFVTFCIVLFEFGKDGFFAFDGFAKFALLWVFLLRVIVGVRFIWMSFPKNYSRIKRIFGDNDSITNDNDNEQQYKMEPINTQGNPDDNVI